jgi:hypothetical protein
LDERRAGVTFGMVFDEDCGGLFGAVLRDEETGRLGEEAGDC